MFPTIYVHLMSVTARWLLCCLSHSEIVFSPLWNFHFITFAIIFVVMSVKSISVCISRTKCNFPAKTGASLVLSGRGAWKKGCLAQREVWVQGGCGGGKTLWSPFMVQWINGIPSFLCLEHPEQPWCTFPNGHCLPTKCVICHLGRTLEFFVIENVD